MKGRADAYLARLFLWRFLACLAGFVGLVELLDLLDNATDMMARGAGGVIALATYAGLRLPLIAFQLVPIAALVAALLALAHIGQTSEVIGLMAAGRSYGRVIGALIPVALLIALGHFALGEFIAPVADRSLRVWLERTAEPEATVERIWVHRGPTVLAFEGVAPDGTWMTGVLVVERDDAGSIVARIDARAAEHADGRWTLHDAVRTNTEGRVIREARMPWPTSIVPGDLAGLARPAQAYGLAELSALQNEARLGTRTQSFYRVQWQKKFSAPLAVPLMVLIAAPVARGRRGRAGSMARLVAGFGVAFLYMIADGLAQVTAEAGALPPVMAAWGPALVFAAIGGAILAFSEA